MLCASIMNRHERSSCVQQNRRDVLFICLTYSVWFRLTVEDSHHATNSTTANITVLKVTDYPPEANAGQDIIMYLPHNNLTLSGNLSTDDRGIASWEWTKSPSDQDKAVDMQVLCCYILSEIYCLWLLSLLLSLSWLSSPLWRCQRRYRCNIWDSRDAG